MVMERISVPLTGPSDSGKSALLNVLGALDKLTRRSDFIGDKAIDNIETNAAFFFRGLSEIGPSWFAHLA